MRRCCPLQCRLQDVIVRCAIGWVLLTVFQADSVLAQASDANILTIFHGGSGTAVPDDEETDPGAFTVGSAGDIEESEEGESESEEGESEEESEEGESEEGSSEEGESEEEEPEEGEPEETYNFPLMQLQINKDALPHCEDDPGYQKGSLVLQTVSGEIRLWKDKEKSEEIAGGAIPLDEDCPSVWIEALVPSEGPRDIELRAEYSYEECAPSEGLTDTVNATAVLLDLDAHLPGAIAAPGELVPEADEEDPQNLIVQQNIDDDDEDGIIDLDREQSTDIAAEDDDLIRLVLRQFAMEEGTLELSAQDGESEAPLRLFTEDGSQELSLPLTLDLANPEGPLAEIGQADVILLAEALDVSDDISVVLSYARTDDEPTQDAVHLTAQA